MMRAMNHLKADGFVMARSTRGTYVVDRPPHLSRFGLVFATDDERFGGSEWNQFWTVLVGEASVIGRSQEIELPVFFAVTDSDSKGYRDLERDLAADRLGGLIVVGRADLLNQQLILDARVPKLAIYGGELEGTPRIYIDRQSFLDQSLDALKAEGVDRVALLASYLPAWSKFTEAAEARGMQTRRYWQHAGWGDEVSRLVELLFSPDQRCVPDGLVIADDNLVNQTVVGLLRAGIGVPEQLKLVAHCNWPAPLPSSLPAVRLGFDVNELLRRCVETLLRQRHGEKVEAVQLLPARVEPAAASPDFAFQPAGRGMSPIA